MDPNVRDHLLKRLLCPAAAQAPLAPLTSFRIGGPAAILAQPRNHQELIALLRIVHSESLSCFYLGLGSNILVSDEGFDGVVIRVQGELTAIQMKGDVIHAGPGVRLLDLTAFAAARGLSGMEPLCGIPGSVGGGLYMNAGAYGGEIADTFLDADVLDGSGRIVTLAKDEIGFGYRSAPAFENAIILESRYRLQTGDRQNIYGEMRRVWKLRRAKQPLEFPSAGSVFKRPPGDYAGRLIEAVGAKGMQIGGAQISPKHAGFIVNVGGATAADVSQLIRQVRKQIYDRFGILLEPEVKAVGFAEDPFTIENR